MGYQYPRQAILAPIGLVTEPNEYGQYPAGALKRAENMLLRAPGKLSQAPYTQHFINVGSAGDRVLKLIGADTGIVYAFLNDAGTWSIFGDTTPQTFVGSAVNAFSATGRISWAQCVERVIVNGKFGCLVRDPTPISTKFRAAGLPQLSITTLNFLAGGGTWLAQDQMVGYRACLVRRYSQDYTLRSTPSVALKIRNSSALLATILVNLKWPAAAGIEPGDIIELYRTDILSTTVSTSDPGATYKLVQEYILTAADIAAPPPAGLVLTDTQAPVVGTLKTPGRELYTNPGVEGETYGNLRPPICECLASFKGFCFYGNTTERAQLTFSVPGGMGPINTAAERQYAVGTRSGAGTVALGSAVVTAVSAAQIVGVKAGQLWTGGPAFPAFPATASVVSVTATSFTMSTVATANGGSWSLDDVIQINGINYRAASLLGLLDSLNGAMEAQVDDTLYFFVAGSGLILTRFSATLMWNYHPFDRSIVVRATNGANFSPPLPEHTSGTADKSIDPIVRKNRLTWSKEQQPEHAPSVSETLIGFGEMYALNATRDALWIWCSDGLHRLSGNGGSLGLGAWQTDYANSTLLLCAPQASTALNEKLYGYTNEGVVEIDSGGNLSHKTRGVIGDLLPGPRYREIPGIILERNETEGELLLQPGDDADIDDLLDHLFVFNVRSRGWTTLHLAAVSAIAMFRLPPGGDPAHVLFGEGGPSFGSQARYSSWIDLGEFVEGFGQYQPIYGDDPLELKRWMWADYLFDQGSLTGVTAEDVIRVLWNSIGFGPVPYRALDAGVYARAGCPRAVGLSHSISPGFSWDDSQTQRAFEGISLAVKQRTNQSKAR